MHLAAESLEQLDPFDHAFVDAVLHLRGIDEPPSLEEFREALAELGTYYAALQASSPAPRAMRWLRVDLAHRLEHLGLPVTNVEGPSVAAPS